MAVGGADIPALMQQLAGGDEAALDQLYTATVGSVYGRALRITGNSADAEEVTCDVYREVWLKAKQFDPQRGTPIQWLMVIARSRALDCSRRRRAHLQGLHVASALHQRDVAPATDELLHQYEMVPALRATLLQLSSVQARVVGLAFFDGLTHREIAEAARLPLGTVKSHLVRALLILRKALTTEYGIAAPGFQSGGSSSSSGR